MKPTRVLGVGIVCILLAGACGGGGGNETPRATTTITVNGRVLARQDSGDLRPPDIGVSVIIEGHPEVVTNGAGEFTVTDVVRPYTVIILGHALDGAVVYAGLTRSDPVLQGPRPDASIYQHATAQGDVSGGVGWPTPPDYETVVSFGNAARGPVAADYANATTGFYDTTLSWLLGSPITVTGAALQFESGVDGVPTSYSGFGTAIIDASDGFVHTGVDIALGPVSSALGSGTLAVPSGYGPCQALLEVDFDAGPRLTLWMGDEVPGPISVLMPDLPTATHRWLLMSTAPTLENVYIARVIQPGDSGLSLQIPTVVQQLGPADGTTDVTDSTVFQVNDHSDRTYSVRYFPVPPSDGPYLYLTTSASSWTLPDLSAYGVTIPAAATYEWRVEGLGEATVDDLCDEMPFKSGASWYSTSTEYTEFTTTP